MIDRSILVNDAREIVSVGLKKNKAKKKKKKEKEQKEIKIK